MQQAGIVCREVNRFDCQNDNDELQDGAEVRRKRRAGGAHSRKRSPSEDEDQIGNEVEDVADQHRDHHRPRDVLRLQVGAEDEEQQHRREAGSAHEQELSVLWRRVEALEKTSATPNPTPLWTFC